MKGLKMLPKVVEDFDARHGGKENCVVVDGWILYRDGAQRETCEMGAQMEPPGDAYERLRLIALFHQTKMKLAIEEFSLLRDNLQGRIAAGMNSIYYVSPPDDSEFERLTELQKRVHELQEQYQKALADFKGSRTFDPERNRAENRERLQTAEARLRAIEI
jgi:hypothetical protein